MAIDVAFQASMSSCHGVTVALAMLLDSVAESHCSYKLFTSLFLEANWRNSALLIVGLKSLFL